MPVRDAALKVTGQFKYVGDMTLPHMLHAKVLFSPVAHARIKSIDTSQAEQLEGVRAVVCWKNAPDALFNSCGEEIDGEKTERVFDSTVRYVGDKVAAVAAETAKIAEQALKLIRVEYEELPYYLEPEDALKEGAYPIHKDSNVIEEVVQEAGDVEKGMAEADYIYDNLTYLDIRKDRSAKEMGGPVENAPDLGWKGYPNSKDDNPSAESAWVPFVGKSWFGVADNARILVDYQFLLDKYSYNSDGGYDGKTYGYMTIYDAWKRGATIEVYSSKDNSKKLGTVPMYKDAADALGACGVDNAWTPDVTE